MKKTAVAIMVPVLFSLVLISPVKAADWRWALGFSYINGFNEIKDIYEENLESEGYEATSVGGIPVGLTLQPYVQFNFGLRLGAGLGPVMLIVGDADFYSLPVNANIGFTLFPSAKVAPYVRGGVLYHWTSGDYIEESSPGAFGAVGLEFMRNNVVAMGIEASVDNAEIELRHRNSRWSRTTMEKVEPFGFTFSVFVIF